MDSTTKPAQEVDEESVDPVALATAPDSTVGTSSASATEGEKGIVTSELESETRNLNSLESAGDNLKVEAVKVTEPSKTVQMDPTLSNLVWNAQAQIDPPVDSQHLKSVDLQHPIPAVVSSMPAPISAMNTIEVKEAQPAKKTAPEESTGCCF